MRPVRWGWLAILTAAGGCGGKAYNPLEAHFNRGVAAYNEGRIDEAISEYQLAAL